MTYIAPMLLLLVACGSLRETASVADDVYTIPDRQAMAAASASDAPPAETSSATDAYYDPAESQRANAAYRDYYDMTYNDPYYYNYGRFGFGTGISSYGPSYGMGMSYGWPTTFGSMSIGFGTGYAGGYGYNPYWGNSWTSGYGYNPYGYYGYGNYGPGYGGYGTGYGPYQGPWGGCYGCYESSGYGNVVYAPRPSMAAGSDHTTPPNAPRMMRNPASLIPSANPSRSSTYQPPTLPGTRSGRITAPSTPSRSTTREPAARPSRNSDNSISIPSRSGGGNSGSDRISSPRPR